MKIFKQELVFWVVHGESSQVKKVRFTIGRILSFSVILLAFVGGLLFVAGDYVRMQWRDMKQAWHLENVAEERDSLLSSNEALQTRLEQLLVSQDETDDFRREVKKRLVELSRVLRSVPSPDLDSARDFVKNKPGDKSGLGGMGGAEIPVRKITADEMGRANPKIFEEGEVLSDEMVFRLEQLLTLMRITPMGKPVAGEITSGFGFRWSPFEEGMLSRHEGIDFGSHKGTSIVATADGIVTDVSTDSTYGLKVDITHHPELMTRYGHMMLAKVHLGQIVRRGDVIGFVGSSGRSTGPHLHYEVRFQGKAVNPEMYLGLHERLAKALG